MLLDRRPDLIAAFGDAALAVTYGTVDELNAKVAYYLTHASERAQLVDHFQQRIRDAHSTQAWLARLVADLRAR
jgi:hypothetical protein